MDERLLPLLLSVRSSYGAVTSPIRRLAVSEERAANESSGLSPPKLPADMVVSYSCY